ncbi:MAG: hypothetical protein Q8M80_16820, partial [Hydrogenophaga sp.]|nr:hypothetical protein [Hydrogenophaga sp.]
VAAGTVVDASRLSNASSAAVDLTPAHLQPCVAAIYQLDGLVRRATSLQLTNDARASSAQIEGVSA